MATGMIEGLIQTIKRRLLVLNNDPKWSKVTLADKVAEIITNSTTKNCSFQSTFRQKKQHTPLQHYNPNIHKKNYHSRV